MRRNQFKFAVLGLLFSIAGWVHAQDLATQTYLDGNNYYSQKNYDLAIPKYQAALQSNPNFWQAYQGLGNCYYFKGDNDKALLNYRKALSLNPNNPQLSQFNQALSAQAAPALPADGQGNFPSPGSSVMTSNPNLPRQGKIIFEIGESDWIGSWSNMDDIYGTIVSSSSSPIGVKLNLGAAYALSPNFQIGAKFQYLRNTPILLNMSSFLGVESDEWNQNALGGILEGEGVFPLGDGVNLRGCLELGYYTLVGSNVVMTGSLLGTPFSGTMDLTGSAPGGMISGGVELLMDSRKTWAVDIDLVYQLLSISPITGKAIVNGTPQKPTVLQNSSNGDNSKLEFTGVGLGIGIRFF